MIFAHSESRNSRHKMPCSFETDVFREYKEEKHGEWVEVSNAYGTEWLCDNCKMGVRHHENQPYCSECGAKMNTQ